MDEVEVDNETVHWNCQDYVIEAIDHLREECCASNITTYSLSLVLPKAGSDVKKCGCPRYDLTATLKGIWRGICTTVNTSTNLPSHL
jgi:hypothetical protein